MWRLAGECGGLDQNSPYAYMLAGLHFARTSVVALDEHGSIVGFVVAYRPPDEDRTVFVWQVAVDDSHRGHGLARRMIDDVTDRAMALGAAALTATVTPSNDASLGLFASVARERNAVCTQRACLGAELFPGDDHEPEHLLVIEPLAPVPPHHSSEPRSPELIPSEALEGRS